MSEEAADPTADVPDDAAAEIADAVRRALAKHGYAGLTTKKVAAESEKSEAFFFYHCDSKHDLILVFLDYASEWSLGRLEAVTDIADPVEKLYVACEALLGDPDDEFSRGMNVAVMELLAHAPHDTAFHDRLEAYERRVLADLASVLEDGIDAGVFRAVDPEATAAFLLMVADGTAGAVHALGMDDVEAGVRDRLFDYLETSVLAEGVTPPEGR
ncbi:TetR/AcrR family transcriptional regulator [Halorarius halobius]|uniref:TetR/AcrR family transcriptional regulator n=1 Tax=Halorarius halobius TaxID=2962671 RepID=UPI0020CF14DE|nr:TetR family transcriptional regulator C-terminal domain-containing protein [Halorarius halobius]